MSSPDDHGPTAPFLAQLGLQLRERRHAAGLTVQQVADRAGVSRRMLTQIEQGQANPSLVTVDKLARALGVDFATLAGASRSEPVSVNAPGTAQPVWSSPAGGSAVLHVAGARTGGAELWAWALAPGDRYDAQPDPAGSEELILVQAGTLTLDVDGRRIALAAGASVRLASDRAYAYENATTTHVSFVRVVQLSNASS